MKITNCIGGVTLACVLAGCNDSVSPAVEQQQPVTANNVTQHPIMLKDLSTGIVYDTKKLPKADFRFEDSRRFKYSYFGEPRETEIKIDQNGLIYAVTMSMGSGNEALLTELESKFTKESGKAIKFACEISAMSLDAMGIKNSKIETKRCKVIHESQELIVEFQKPLGTAAVTRIDLHRGTLKLTDKKLEKAFIDKRRSADTSADARNQKKRQSDI